MTHSFDVNIAKEYGIQEAILFNHLSFWIEKNKANDKHHYDGYYWTYSSKKAFTELFPYLTERQVDYSLKKLLDNGLIIKGNYNKSGYDRTLWYAITKKGYSILQNCRMEQTNLLNGIDNNVQPIPDITTDNNTNIKTNINSQGKLDQSKEESNWEKQFEKFYSEYPKKVKKQNVKKWFQKNKPSGELFSSMLNSLEQFRGSKEWKENNGQFIPYPSTWLNQRRWEDEDIMEKQKEAKVTYKEINTEGLTDEEYRKLLQGG